MSSNIWRSIPGKLRNIYYFSARYRKKNWGKSLIFSNIRIWKDYNPRLDLVNMVVSPLLFTINWVNSLNRVWINSKIWKGSWSLFIKSSISLSLGSLNWILGVVLPCTNQEEYYIIKNSKSGKGTTVVSFHN